MAQQITVEQYHAALRTASIDNHPFMDAPNALVIGKAFADMTHAVAAFVDAARFNDAIGYKEARSCLEDLVHTYPVVRDPLEEEDANPLAGLGKPATSDGSIRVLTLSDLMDALGDMFSTQDDEDAEEAK